MSFWRLYYHAVWATKDRMPIISDAMVAAIAEAIESTTSDLGVYVFAVGVMPDHIHVFSQIPPTSEVAKVIGRWKGASSHVVNERFPHVIAKLTWQSGYGVLSVSQSGFDQVKAYVENQRERHAKRELYGVLERVDAKETRLLPSPNTRK